MAASASDILGVQDIGYFVLPSNTPDELTGQAINKTNHYTVKLPRAMDLTSMNGKKFEVGLSEIAYPHSWDSSFEASRCMYEIAVVDLRRALKPAKKIKACLPKNTPVKNYLHVESLINGLNDRIPKTYIGSEKNIQKGDWVDEWKGEFRVKKQRAQIILCHGDAIELNRDLANALGFEKTVYFFSEGVELKRKCGTSLEEDNAAEFGAQKDSNGLPKNERKKTRAGILSSGNQRTNIRSNRSVAVETDKPTTSALGNVEETSEITGAVGGTTVGDDEMKDSPPMMEQDSVNPRPIGRAEGKATTGLVKETLPPVEQVPRYMIRAEKEPNLQFDRHNIFVYCNLVKPTFCGNGFYPVLRTVAVNSDNRNKYVSKTFERIHYLPLAGDFFNEIEIDLRFEDGSPVRFLWGKVICILHFRERHPSRS